MKLKSNFQRYLFLFLYNFLNYSILFGLYIILHFYYNIPFSGVILIFSLVGLYLLLFIMIDIKQIIFNKYCNKECTNCNVYFCDFKVKSQKFT